MATGYAGSVQSHSFARAPGMQIPRSTFDRSHGHKTAFDFGYLIPVLCEEMVPADTIDVTENAFGRMATQIVPILHPMYLETFYFFVPCRLLWDKWDHFHGAIDDPADVGTDYTIPQITTGAGVPVNSPMDYMGIPPGVNCDAGSQDINVSALPFRAYNLIYNEWFRDQDVIDSFYFSTLDGPESDTLFTLHKRAKRPDYFTSCRPWPVKDTAEQTIPLGSSAPVTLTSGHIVGDGSAPTFTVNAVSRTLDKESGTNKAVWTGSTTGAGTAVWDDAHLDLNDLTGSADLSSATAATINQLREAFSIQHALEIDARSGTRLVEHHLAHFGVYPPDMRTQRPEYLGGSSTAINVNPVAQTAEGTTYDRADLSAFATAAMGGKRIVYSAVEYGYLIGIANARADVTYQQGIHKKFQRIDRFDFYLPSLAHLGEQAVENSELVASHNDPDGVFGYQERWAEMRYGESRVSGFLRSDYASTLEVWHLAVDLADDVSLDQDFVEDNPDVNRVTATTEIDFKADFYWQIKHTRPMPTFSVPGLVTRF